MRRAARPLPSTDADDDTDTDTASFAAAVTTTCVSAMNDVIVFPHYFSHCSHYVPGRGPRLHCSKAIMNERARPGPRFG